jgi:hypothetical protein
MLQLRRFQMLTQQRFQIRQLRPRMGGEGGSRLLRGPLRCGASYSRRRSRSQASTRQSETRAERQQSASRAPAERQQSASRAPAERQQSASRAPAEPSAERRARATRTRHAGAATPWETGGLRGRRATGDSGPGPDSRRSRSGSRPKRRRA